jgi:putative transposase
MPRGRRWFFPGVSLHVVQRGNNRCDIFRYETDREVFLCALHSACETLGVSVHAYALMTNHVHLVMTPSMKDSLARAMQFVGRFYVPYFNRRHQRTGGLFEGRYRAAHIHSEDYWYNSVRYVEMNPVRAGLVDRPGDYAWSSYRPLAYGEPDPILSPHASYERLGKTAAARQQAWRAFCSAPLSEEELRTIRTRTICRASSGILKPQAQARFPPDP